MFNQYILTIIIVSSISSNLINNNESCIKLKSIFYKQITLFKDLNQDKRNTLFDSSLRGIMYDFMASVQFSDNNLNQHAQLLTIKINEVRDKMDKKEQFNNQNSKVLMDLNLKWQQITSYELLNLQAIQKNNQETTALRQKLGQLKNKMTSTYPDLEQKIQLLKDLNGFKANLETEHSTSSSLLSVLDEIEKIFGESNMTFPEHLISFQQKLIDYLKVEDIIKNEEEIQKSFNLTKVDLVVADLNTLVVDKYNLSSDLGNEIYYLKNELQVVIDELQNNILAIKEYQEYQGLLKEGKDLIVLSHELVKKDKEFKKKLKSIEFAKESIKYRRIRIHPKEFIDFERKMNNLKSFINLLSKDFDSSELTDQGQINVNMKNFYKQNMTRLPEMNEIYQSMTTEWNSLDELRVNEGELDKLFGKAIGYLQGGSTNDESFKKCFINLELSVYMFYMSLFQVVVSQKDFYWSMMNEFSEESQTELIKQLFRDLRSDPFEDPQMINYYTGKLVDGGLERSMNNYDLMINSQMDKIFHEQITRDEKTGWYYTIMYYANFTYDMVTSVLKKGTLSIIFSAIITAIFAVFAIAKIPLLLMIFLCGLLSVLSELFFTWVGDKIKENPWIREAWDRGVARVIGIFSPNKVDSLDVDEVLNDQYLIDNGEIKMFEGQDEERYDYYNQKFLEIVKINNNYTQMASEHSHMVLI